MDINKFIEKSDVTVSQAMLRIDANGYRIIFLVDEKGCLFGSVTDGDIRRFLLLGGNLNECAEKAANKNVRCAFSMEVARDLYDKKDFPVIPIVDANQFIKEVYTGEESLRPEGERRSLNVPVVINAGGMGKRLEPYTKVLPKPLLPIDDVPMIERIMREYQSNGCEDFHIIVNYKKELIKAYFADEKVHNYHISWHEEKKPLGTGGGISLLKGEILETFIFANCDTLLIHDNVDAYQWHKENKDAITMICAKRSIKIPYGTVKTTEQNDIVMITEKPELSFMVNTGVYIVEPEIIEDVKDGESIDFINLIERARDCGRKVSVFTIAEEDWIDLAQIGELERKNREGRFM